jgi:predicted aconitase with swiveling domain
LTVANFDAVRKVLSGVAHRPVVAAAEGLSFWGGVDPATSRVIDVHHPVHGVSLAGSILMMPTSRVRRLADMALNGWRAHASQLRASE